MIGFSASTSCCQWCTRMCSCCANCADSVDNDDDVETEVALCEAATVAVEVVEMDESGGSARGGGELPKTVDGRGGMCAVELGIGVIGGVN